MEACTWAQDTLNESEYGYSPQQNFGELLSYLGQKFYTKYATGEFSFEDARSEAVIYTEAYFDNSVTQLMYDEGPSTVEWYAAHIFRACEMYVYCRDTTADKYKELEAAAGIDIKEGCEETNNKRVGNVAWAVELGMKAGFLYRDAWWKFNHEQAAIAYYEQVDARQRGSSKGGDANASRYERLRQDCLAYIPQAYLEHGSVVVAGRADKIAKIIRDIALRERPDDFVGPQGKPLAPKWFIETIEDFQSNGELGQAIEAFFENRA